MTIQIIPATTQDIREMVALSYQKRRDYEKAQPQFWQYAEGAEKIQDDWFRELLGKDDHIILVAKSEQKIIGFIIGRITPCPEVYAAGLTLMIDDFCVSSLDLWESVGKKLIEEIKISSKKKEAQQILIVCGAHDKPKREFLKNTNLSIASEWYVGGV